MPRRAQDRAHRRGHLSAKPQRGRLALMPNAWCGGFACIREQGLAPTMHVGGDKRTKWCLQTQHQLNVLHRSAAGAFAQVVQAGDQHRMASLFVGKHPDFQLVGVVQRGGVELAICPWRAARSPNRAAWFGRVMRAQSVVQVSGFGLAGQAVQVQGQLHQHALAEVAHRWHKQGAAAQARCSA
jgi:hypothetical protein